MLQKRRKHPPVSHTDKVDEYMAALQHPLKDEVQLVREIITGMDKNITEEVKWNAPSFSYQGEYLVTFNLRNPEHIHLVFHNPLISQVKSKLLEGEYVDRCMAYFANRQDVMAKKLALEKVIKNLVKLIKRENSHG